MKLSRDKLIELAEKAGYSIQINCWASDGGTTADTFEKNVWGGRMETVKLMRFAQLLEAHFAEAS